MPKRVRLLESVKKRVAAAGLWRCQDCKSLLPPTYQIDHITPVALGGTNDEANLQALCPNCHSAKTQREQAKIMEAQALRSSRACRGCGHIVSTYFEHDCSEGIGSILHVM